MNRSVVRSALGRSRLEVTRSSISQYPTTTPRHFFSTTESLLVDEGSSDKPSPPPRTSSPSQQRSQSAATQLGSLNSDSGSAPRPARLDARNLAASPAGRGGPKIINLRSLGRTPFAPRGGRGGAARGDGSSHQPRFGQNGAPRGGGHARMSNAFQKFSADNRSGGFGGRGNSSRGGGRGTGRGGRGGGMRKKFDKKDKKKDNDDDKFYKLTWSKEEQEFIDADEQGVVTKYTPSATLADYSGYGPALATDSPLGKVESALRSMRIVGGGKPFCPDGYYTDDKATLKRYREEKKPVFFDDVKEKEWLVQMTGFNLEKKGIEGPDEKTKAAIIQSAIQGKYPAPKFVDLKNTIETLANYHTKQDTWMPTDGKAFDDKVRSLLPAARKPAPKAAAKAKA
ncbi:hypothetical protein GE09DRAFT_183239 [Coniochaeta sp. 2T2.1]|nr:hypothetical protein GE09DRAFT_183239 [Coniochaeta sp. 2T2.1]